MLGYIVTVFLPFGKYFLYGVKKANKMVKALKTKGSGIF